MGTNIPGSGGYTQQELQGAKNKGDLKNFIYREQQSDGGMKTIQGQ